MRTKGIALLAVLALVAIGQSCVTAVNKNALGSQTAYLTLPTVNGVAVYNITDSLNFEPVVGSPYIGGESPSSLVVHPTKGIIYVSNQGDNTISLFKIDPTSRGLVEVHPRTRTQIFPTSLCIDQAGAHLFALNVGSASISAFSISSGDGSLTEVAGSPFATYTNPTSMIASPSGKFLYVLNVNVRLLYGYANNNGTLQAIPGSPFAVGATPSSVVIDPAEKFMYVTDSGSNTVTAYTIDANGTPTKVPQSPFVTDTTPVASLIDPSGQFLYIGHSGANDIWAYAIDSSTGIPTLLDTNSSVPSNHPALMHMDTTGRIVFVVNSSGKLITSFSLDSTTGELTATNQTTTISWPLTSMAVIK